MAEVITLSSDEEEKEISPPKKKIKLITLTKTEHLPNNAKKTEPCIVLLSDDEDATELKLEPSTIKLLEKVPCLDVVPLAKLEPQPELNKTQNGVVDVSEKDQLQIIPLDPAPVSATPECEANGENLSSHELSGESTTKDTEIENEFFVFLDDCIQTLSNPEHKKLMIAKLPIMKKLHEKLKKDVDNFEKFREVVKNNAERMKSRPVEAIVCFNEVYVWAKSAFKEALKAKNTNEHRAMIIKKLEKTFVKIQQKIKTLEESEVDFDEEENSAYIQVARYKERAAQIYGKLCSYRNENPNKGCQLYYRLDFSHSNFSEINRALNKKYKNNPEFPTFYNVDKCVRECVQEQNLDISETKLKSEIKSCFEKLGELIQRRRRLDLYYAHSSFIENTTDPARGDATIESELRAHRTEANEKLEQVFQKYTRLQEKGVNPDVSSESEDSDVVNSESDTEQNENVSENI